MAARKASLTNAAAAEATLAALRKADRLKPEDEALVQLIRTLAGLLDGDELDARSYGSVAAQYRAALDDLRKASADDGVDDDEAATIATLSIPVRTKVGHSS